MVVRVPSRQKRGIPLIVEVSVWYQVVFGAKSFPCRLDAKESISDRRCGEEILLADIDRRRCLPGHDVPPGGCDSL